MSKSTPIKTYRVVLPEDELFELMTILSESKNSVGLSALGTKLYNRFDVQAYKANAGIATPAYIATGTGSKEAHTSRTLDSLGATEDEKYSAIYDAHTKSESVMDSAEHLALTGEKVQWWLFAEKRIDAVHTGQFQQSQSASQSTSEPYQSSDSLDAELFAALTDSLTAHSVQSQEGNKS